MMLHPADLGTLKGTPIPEVRNLKRVLVMGDGHGARLLSDRLIAEGLDVLIHGPSGSDFGHLPIIPSDMSLEKVSGFVGCFDVLFRGPAGVVKESVGHIVVARPPRLEANFRDYGLQPSERVISLTDLENMPPSWSPPRGEGARWIHIAFLFGIKGEPGPESFNRLLTAVERMVQNEGVQTYVFLRHAKVAGFGLESRYGDLRRKGALFLKVEQ
ncbi:MAG: hypothetical protein V2B18_25530, partial [Pseudomonadota bacterium]